MKPTLPVWVLCPITADEFLFEMKWDHEIPHFEKNMKIDEVNVNIAGINKEVEIFKFTSPSV